MLNQKKVEIFSRKFRKSLAKQFLEVAYNEWDGYIPWAMYCVVGTDEYKDMDSIDIGKIIVGEIEEQFRRNFGPGNCGKEFEKEYLGFREKKLAYVTLDEYMKHFGMSFMP